LRRAPGFHNAFESSFVGYYKREPPCLLPELPSLEFGKQPRHGFSRSPDYLGDFLVREGQCELDLAVSFVMIRDKLEQEASEFCETPGRCDAPRSWQYHP
jgi:hypothetical protein